MMRARFLRLLLLGLLVVPILASAAAAQWLEEPETDEPPRTDDGSIDLEQLDADHRERAKLYPVRDRVSRYMTAAAKATDAGDTDKARGLLAKLSPKRLNPSERALVFRLEAYVHYTAGDLDGAIASFEKVLAEEILPLKDETRIRFNIAQLQAGQQNWRGSLEALDRWELYVEQPDPLAYYLRAISYFQLEEFDEAIANAEKAVDLADTPREGWLQLLAALYIQKEDYRDATPVLEELIFRFPKKLYWVQLSLIYGAREEYPNSLAVQQVAYLQGLLTDDKELRRLARSYLYSNLPYPAARVLEKGLAEGIVEPDVDSYEMLANSWIASREYDKSLAPLKKAAALSKDGNLYARLGQVHLQQEEWKEAAQMLQRAVEKGGLKNPGQALLLLGISYYNDQQVGQARSFFARAREHDATRPEAERWIEHLDSESRTAEAVGGSEANPT